MQPNDFVDQPARCIGSEGPISISPHQQLADPITVDVLGVCGRDECVTDERPLLTGIENDEQQAVSDCYALDDTHSQ